jgi:hypothetical protein
MPTSNFFCSSPFIPLHFSHFDVLENLWNHALEIWYMPRNDSSWWKLRKAWHCKRKKS